ncbi:MAG TPA: O-antigen ligase family protein, partial [Desulfuromonadaceae bacterium]|nr:O-antigen ligase family protein [Desulfuromonadaceae bacterium]
MNRDVLDKYLERGILALVLAILVFAPLAMGAVDAWAFLVIQGLTIVILALWIIRVWAGPRPQLLWPPLCWAVLAFVVYAVVRYLTADIEYVARLESIQVLVYAFLFFAVVNNVYRQEFPQVISFTMIFVAAMISGYAIYQSMAHSNRVWNMVSPYVGRASGTYISPNNLAGLLEMVLPLALAYVLTGRIKVVSRIFIAYAALMIAGGLVVTFSRGGWMAAGLAMLVLLGLLTLYRQHRIPVLVLLAVLLAGGGFFAKQYLSRTLSYIERIQKPVLEGEGDLDYRREMWQAAEGMWRDHFWLGVGPAHYDYRFRLYHAE